MKTYKEMAERVLSRRDEYEDRKQRRRKTAGSVSVSVFASLVLVVSMILGPMFGTLLKKPTPASPVTDASSNETAETRSVSTEEQTDDITAETTGEQTTTDEQTTKDVQTTIETEAWELIDVSELSGYTVYAWDNDYGLNVLFGSKKTEKPEEDFHTLSGLISDAYSGSVTKTFEYNGKSVELTYAGTKDSSLGDMGKISVYTYNDADFSEVILGRRNEKFTSEVSFYENGEICEISGSLLGSVETDGGYDIEALKAAVMEKYGETFDFSRYEFSDTGEFRATVKGITYRWYNEKCGARVNDGIFISVLVNGSVSRVIYPSREYIKDLDVKFTFDELTAIVNDKTEKALAERGYKRITPEEKDIYHAWWKFDVYRGKPAFYCQDAVHYADGDNKACTVLAAYLIVIDNQQ